MGRPLDFCKKKTARKVCSEALWAEMSATGGKVGTVAGLQFFWLLSVEDLQALCIDASKT